MIMSVFNATCPVEIGDKVATFEKHAAAGKTDTMMGAALVQTITDIAAVHYVKTGKVEFKYELDGNGQYLPLQFPSK